MNKKAAVIVAGLFSLTVVAGSVIVVSSASGVIHDNSMTTLAAKLDDFYYTRTSAVATTEPVIEEPVIEEPPAEPLDEEPPVVKIMMASSDVMTNETSSVHVNVTDNDEVDEKSVTLTLDGDEVKAKDGLYTLPELSDGEHVLHATACDITGNEGSDEVRFNVTLYQEPEPEVPDYIANANLEWLEFDEEQGRWFYTVREGDYLIKIMGRINVSVEVMDKYNDNIYDPDLIFTGNRIYVTAPGQENKNKWEAGITFLDGHDRDELTFYTDEDGNIVDADGNPIEGANSKADKKKSDKNQTEKAAEETAAAD